MIATETIVHQRPKDEDGRHIYVRLSTAFNNKKPQLLPYIYNTYIVSCSRARFANSRTIQSINHWPGLCS